MYKITRPIWTRVMAQVVECLLCNLKALSSNPQLKIRKEREREREREREGGRQGGRKEEKLPSEEWGQPWKRDVRFKSQLHPQGRLVLASVPICNDEDMTSTWLGHDSDCFTWS
jgi:hypothetical protein